MSRVTHFEIHAEKPGRAAEFYKGVFGWEISKWDGPVDYWLVKTGPDDQPGINGAILQRMGGSEASAVIAYVCTIDVANLDDSLTKIVASGGSMALDKRAVPMVGWQAYCKDKIGRAHV